MARKLHATLKGAGAKPDMVTICLVPATGAADARATATLARDLRRALRGFGPTLWLDETAARGVFNDDTVGKMQSKFYRSKMTGWMAQQEENYRFILLQADAGASPWSQVCVSQADKILVVARASNPDPDPRAHERRLLWRRRRGAATELVLVHDPGEPPRNLRRFRATRPDVGRHHPLRLEAEEDLQRLARHIAGHAVGVVLTGGGGHGLAHLGALRALEDSGVPVDCVGGTSQGALMAALYARHASTTHMLPRVKELVGALSSPRHLLTDLTLPVLSVFSGKGVDRILRTVLGDTDIEDLWLSFFCVSTNLTSGGLSTHTSGTVWRYVRASMTILGMLPPVRDDQTGDLLVDGGYLNAIPVDVLRERMGVETVVVVDVEDNDYTAFRNLTPHDGGLGGWRLLWERINPFGSWLGRWFSGPSIDEASPASGGGGGGGGSGAREREGTRERRLKAAAERAKRRVDRADAISPFLGEESRPTPEMFDASELAARRERERAGRARPRATIRTEYGDVMDR
uniref:Patatin n=1 Tax=Micromonas pusilla TaxID=38833 RepID=A0A7S0NQE9_MICPS